MGDTRSIWAETKHKYVWHMTWVPMGEPLTLPAEAVIVSEDMVGGEAPGTYDMQVVWRERID